MSTHTSSEPVTFNVMVGPKASQDEKGYREGKVENDMDFLESMVAL
jgi:hypothetical protein